MTSRGARYWNSGAIPLIAPDILGTIIAEVADLAIVVTEKGRVLSVIASPDHSGYQALESYAGRDIRECFATESVAKFNSRIDEYIATGVTPKGIELNHADAKGNWGFPVRYTLHRIGPSGEILMLGRDLRPVAEMQQRLVQAQLSLERDYEAQRESDTRFRVVMETSPEAMVFVSLSSGKITDVNAAATRLLAVPGEDVVGRAFAPELELKKQSGDVMDALIGQAMSERPSPVPIMLRRSATDVTIAPVIFRAAGQRLMMCRIAEDVRGEAGNGSVTANLEGLYHNAPEGIVFARADGTILSVNEGFLDLVDAAHDAGVKGRSLADFLARGSVDLKVMTENASRSGKMRMFPTKVTGAFGAPRSVEVSVTTVATGSAPVFGFVLRDASRMDQVRPGPSDGTPAGDRSVMELVGSASLKDIVAETTNVVERMCIETAVQLTMNNRVAAAEMLGLSRQSLYVKLRKYDLLSRDDPAGSDS